MIYCRNDARSNRSERKEEVAEKQNCTNSTVSIAGRLCRRAAGLAVNGIALILLRLDWPPFAAGLTLRIKKARYAFSTLGLIPALVRAVDKAGYAAPTAIQAAAIPAILRGSDAGRRADGFRQDGRLRAAAAAGADGAAAGPRRARADPRADARAGGAGGADGTRYPPLPVS
jgi:hypothetical protein